MLPGKSPTPYGRSDGAHDEYNDPADSAHSSKFAHLKQVVNGKQ